MSKNEEVLDLRSFTRTEDFITVVLPQLTVAEKVSLLSGSSFVAASGLPRLGIPAIRLVDSVNGVKGTSHINGIPMLCFPSTTCLGSTWNQSLMTEMGHEIAVQAKHKGASVILGPTVNIHRDPRGGRDFEQMRILIQDLNLELNINS